MTTTDKTFFRRIAKVSLARDEAELLNTLLRATLKSVSIWGHRKGAFNATNRDRQILLAVDHAIAQAKERTR